MLKKFASAFVKFWRDNVVAGVISSSIVGLASWSWWDSVKAAGRTALDLLSSATTFIQQPIPTPLWVLAVLGALATFLAVLFALAILERSNPTAQPAPTWKDYSQDEFYGVKWNWRYSDSGRIFSLTPLCQKCSCEVEAFDHGFGMATSFGCIKCGHRSPEVSGGTDRVGPRVEALIRQKLRTGDWQHVVSQA